MTGLIRAGLIDLDRFEVTAFALDRAMRRPRMPQLTPLRSR